jgi:hypothetical protein
MLDSVYRNRKTGTTEGILEVSYKLSRSRAGQLGFGRLYGSMPSLERLQNECRATLCREYYYDLDIVNCQPTLLTQLVKKELGLDMPILTDYVKNRDTFLLELMAAHDITRLDAKDAVIAVIYGETPKYPLLRMISLETRDKAKELAKLSQYAELFASVRNEKNIYAKFLSFAAQTEERRCMLAMRDFLLTHGWEVDVLCYDGVMVRRREGESISEDFLAEIAAYVKEKTGYDIQIKEKEQVGFSDLPMKYEDPALIAYRDMKTEFERNHFYFMPTNTVCSIETKHGITHYGMEHAMIAFNGMTLPGGSTEDPNLFIKRWIKDGSRRIVKSLVYKHPDECAEDEASIFTGFAFEEMAGVDAEAVALFSDILRSVCGDDEEVFNYVLRYLAHILQKPFEIPGTALIFSSKKHGTGKDTLGNIMRWMIGTTHSSHYNSETQFWNAHDTSKEGCLFAQMEEVGSTANKAKKNELKALITADSMSINPKGVRAYNVPNCIRLFMTTNEPDPVKLEESDRRFMVITPSNRLHARGLEWWATTQPRLKTPAFLGTVGRWLASLDLTGWNPRVMPTTKEKIELAEASLPVEFLFLQDYARNITELTQVNPTELYREYRRWYKEQEMETKFMRISAQSLGIHVSRYATETVGGCLFTKGTDSTGGRFYRFQPTAA